MQACHLTSTKAANKGEVHLTVGQIGPLCSASRSIAHQNRASIWFDRKLQLFLASLGFPEAVLRIESWQKVGSGFKGGSGTEQRHCTGRRTSEAGLCWQEAVAVQQRWVPAS